MSVTRSYKRKREWDVEHWRQRTAAARQRARMAVGAAGIPRILRLAEVEIVTGKSRTVIYREMQAGTFPIPIRLGGRAVGWLEDELRRWLERRIAERDEKRRADSGLNLEAPA
jgi:prophage regulatory protein